MKKAEEAALFDAKKFFVLPVVEEFEPMVSPLVSRHQPVGFFDKEGDVWFPVVDDEGILKRQKR